MNKKFLYAQSFMNDSFKLAEKIHNSGYIPDVVIGIWRGGSIPAMVIHEYLNFMGEHTQSKVITAKSYTGIGEQSEQIDIDISENLLVFLRSVDNILLVDDVVDSGRTIEEIYKEFDRNYISAKIKIASIYYKPKVSSIMPDFYLHDTDEWIVFPHELIGLKNNELLQKNLDVFR